MMNQIKVDIHDLITAFKVNYPRLGKRPFLIIIGLLLLYPIQLSEIIASTEKLILFVSDFYILEKLSDFYSKYSILFQCGLTLAILILQYIFLLQIKNVKLKISTIIQIVKKLPIVALSYFAFLFYGFHYLIGSLILGSATVGLNFILSEHPLFSNDLFNKFIQYGGTSVLALGALYFSYKLAIIVIDLFFLPLTILDQDLNLSNATQYCREFSRKRRFLIVFLLLSTLIITLYIWATISQDDPKLFLITLGIVLSNSINIVINPIIYNTISTQKK